MRIDFACECGQLLHARADMAGKRVPCSACGRTQPVPPASTNPSATSPAPRPRKKRRTPREAPPRRNRGLIAGVGGAIVVVLAVALVALFWPRGRSSVPPGVPPGDLVAADRPQTPEPKDARGPQPVAPTTSRPAVPPVVVPADPPPKKPEEPLVNKGPELRVDEPVRLVARVRHLGGGGMTLAQIRSAVFSPDGLQVFGAGDDVEARWGVGGGFQGGSQCPVRVVAYSSDGQRRLGSTDTGGVFVWDAASGNEIGKCDLGRPPMKPEPRPAFLPGRPAQGPSVEIHGVAFAPDGRHALAATAEVNVPAPGKFVHSNFALRLYEVLRGKEVLRFPVKHTERITCLAVSADGRRAVSGGADKTVRVWDMTTGKEVRSLEGHTGPVNAVTLSADGKLAVSGGGTYDHAKLAQLLRERKDGKAALIDPTVRVWDVEAGKEIGRLEHISTVHCVALSPDRRLVAGGTSSLKDSVRLWEVESGKELCSLSGTAESGRNTGGADSVAFSPDGRLLAAASTGNHAVFIWRLPVAPAVAQLPAAPAEKATPLGEVHNLTGHDGPVTAVAFLPDGRRAVSAGLDHTLRVWDLQGGKELSRQERPNVALLSLVVAPSGAQVLTGSAFRPGIKPGDPDGACPTHLWNVDGGQKPRVFAGPAATYGAVFLPGTGRLVTGDDHGLRLWELGTGRLLQSWTRLELPEDAHTERVSFLLPAAGGSRVLSGSDDKTLKMWDLGTGRVVQTFLGHTAAVTCGTFTADGRHLLSGSRDNTLVLWDVPKGTEVRTFEGHSGGVLRVSLTADGRQALSVDGHGRVILWDLQAGKAVERYRADVERVRCAAIAPDRRRMLFGTEDGAIRLAELPK